MRAAFALAVPLLLTIGFAGSIPLTAFAVALTGTVIAVLWPLANALLVDRASRLYRSPAEVFGFSVMAWSFGLGAGSLLCGAVAGLLGDGAGVAVLALPCLLGLVLLGRPEAADDVRLHRLDPQIVNSVH
jgi:MFS family permease